MDVYTGRIGIIQRVLPAYRAPFFDLLAEHCLGGVQVLTGSPKLDEEIKVATSLEKASWILKKTTYFEQFGKLNLNFLWLHGVSKWISDWNPDILIIPSNPRDIHLLRAINQQKKKGNCIIAWGLGELPREGPALIKKIRQTGAHMLWRRADGIIAYSSKGACDYSKYYPYPERVFVAHNSVDSSNAQAFQTLFEREPHILNDWKTKVGIQNQKVLLYVGRLKPHKRIDLLIKACENLGKDYTLLIVGEGSERSILEELAREYGVDILFVGYKKGLELALCFAVADVFVLPGQGGLAIYEAMLYGKPVLVANGDGTEQDLVEDGVNGYLIHPNDVKDLHSKIQLVFSNSNNLHQMGCESRNKAKKLGIESMVQTFINAFYSVCKNPNSTKIVD